MDTEPIVDRANNNRDGEVDTSTWDALGALGAAIK